MSICASPLKPVPYFVSILPGQPARCGSRLDLHGQAYRHYRDVWLRTVRRSQGEASANVENFLRYDYVISTMDSNKNEVIAQLACKVVDLQSAMIDDMPSFEPYRGPTRTLLEKHGITRVLTLEANTVASRHSRRHTGIPFVEISIQLAIQLARSLEISACLGLARRVTGVQNITQQMGFRTVEQEKPCFGTVVDVVVLLTPEAKEHHDPELKELIETLWHSRIEPG